MGDPLILLALAAFLAGAVYGGVRRSWAIMLVAIGLFLLTLNGAGWIGS